MAAPQSAANAVLLKSEEMPKDSVLVSGYDFNEGIDHHKLLQTYLTSGFQATNFGKAVSEINKMVRQYFKNCVMFQRHCIALLAHEKALPRP